MELHRTEDTWEIFVVILCNRRIDFLEIHSQTPHVWSYCSHFSCPITIHFYGLMYALDASQCLFSSHGGFFKKGELFSEAIERYSLTMLFGVLGERFSTLCLQSIIHFSKPCDIIAFWNSGGIASACLFMADLLRNLWLVGIPKQQNFSFSCSCWSFSSCYCSGLAPGKTWYSSIWTCVGRITDVPVGNGFWGWKNRHPVQLSCRSVGIFFGILSFISQQKKCQNTRNFSYLFLMTSALFRLVWSFSGSIHIDFKFLGPAWTMAFLLLFIGNASLFHQNTCQIQKK